MFQLFDRSTALDAETFSADVDSAAVTVPDAELLFRGEYQRVGSSGLKIVGEDGKSFFIADYFVKRPYLMSPEGATLSAHVVESLAGPLAPGQFAQAGGAAASAPVIGRVDALSGSATVVRNGVTVSLNVGDNVRQGDVVQTSGSSSVAIVFADGSTFSLSANARMVLDSFVFNAGGTGNAAAISLVQGAFSFIAGQVAKTGDMRVETPVATLGIRGTAVLVEISANDGRTRFSVMVEPDGSTGAFNVYNKTTGALIATVNNSQIAWVVSPVGPLQVIAQQEQKTPAQLQQELGIVQQIFTIFNNNQQNPFVPQDSPERRGDNPNNIQTAQGGGSSGEALSVSVQIPGDNSSADGGFVTATVALNPIGTVSGPASPPSTTVTTPAAGGTAPQPTDGGSGNPFDFSKAKTGQVITGSDADDVIIGSGFDDTIDAAAGNDLVMGGAGNDDIIAGHGEGDDSYDGGVGTDTVSFVSANGVVFHLNESVLANGDKLSRAQSFFTGNDVFTNIESIVASPGNDLFYVHLDGSWSIDALAGFDTLSFTNRSEGLVISLGAGGSTGVAGTATSTQLGTVGFVNIESIVGSSGNDAFVVNDLPEWVAVGGEPIWIVDGGEGTDELRVIGSNGLTYNLDPDPSNASQPTIDLPNGQLRFSGFESIIAGAGHDTFVFRDLSTPAIDAGAGTDTLRLVDGTDILDLSAGPGIANFEILDLAADSASNTIHLDLTDFGRIGSLPLRVRGNENDVIKLTNIAGVSAEIVRVQSNVLSETAFSDGLTDGVRFDVYRVSAGTDQHLVYIQRGVQVGTPVGANDDQGTMGEKQNAQFDVLANDTGGILATLTALDVVSVVGPPGIALGTPSITIADNKISIAPGTAFNALAPGQVAIITIDYTMQNGIGEVSSATATITIIGANDPPVISGAVTGQAVEDGPDVTLNGLSNASDADGNPLGLIVVLNNLPEGVTYNGTTQSFTLDPGHAAYQSLAAGQQSVVQVNYHVFDGVVSSPAAVSWTVTGTNDAPVVSGPVTGDATEQGAPVTLDALKNAYDPDAGTTLSVVNIPNNLPSGVTYNPLTQTFTLDPASAAYQALAQGQQTTVTVNYGVSDGIATTPASVLWTVTGTNDVPVVSGTVTGEATEDGSLVSLNALANASDPDAGTTLSVVNIPSNLPLGVTYNPLAQTFALDPASAAYQALAQGQQTTVTVHYGVSDGIATTPASVSWTVTGTNDAPVVSGAVMGAATEGGPPVTLNARANASDVDANAALSVVDIPATLPAGVIFNAVNQTFTLDPAHGDYQSLAESEQLTVTVSYGISDGIVTTPASASWTVTGTAAEPVAFDDAREISENAVTLIDVLANDAVGIANKSLVSLGTATITGPQGVPLDLPGISIENDQIRITPGTAFDALAQGQTATIVIPYTMQANGTQLSATATVTVLGANDAPVIVVADTTGSVSADSPLGSVAAGYLTAGNSLINGLGGSAGFGEGLLDRNDDLSTSAINITAIFGEQGLNFFGSYYNSIYINNNGNITFNGPLSSFTPSQIAGGGNNPIIAPFWADVDTRPTTSLSPTPGGNSTGANLVYYDLDAENGVLTITWDDVGYFSEKTNKLNAFQLQLIDRGNGDFDILFRYEDIDWTTGDASGGSGGLGGTPARAGYTAGDNNAAHYFELAGSGTEGAMRALDTTIGSTGLAGVHVFEVRSGAVSTPSTAGTIQFYDVDANDSHIVSVAYNPAMSSGSTALGALNTTLAQQAGLVTWQYIIDPAVLSGLEPGSNHIEVFDVTIDDGKGGTVTQPVTITVYGPQGGTLDGPLVGFSAPYVEEDNAAPIVSNINFIDVVYEDVPFHFDPAAFVANATDPDGDIISLGTVADSLHGASVTLNPDGSVTYDPTASAIIHALNSGQTIEDTFEFTLRDEHGAISNTAIARLIVYGANEFSI